MSQIPEFNDNQYDEAAYLKRLSDTKDLMLVAVVNHVQVGFKVGYDRDKDGSFTVGWAALLLIIENKRLRKI
jgi:predicted lipid carrier protein YhbT